MSSTLHKRLAIHGARPLVLCIEDEPTQLEIRKLVLEQNGYNVIGVSSADDALETLREAPICATIADHMLQGSAKSPSLPKQMKKIKPDVPVILYSGALPEDLTGVDVYIYKGEPTESFLRILGEVVERFCS